MQYGFWSVVPPILTIVLALVTKNVFISLLIGIFTSSMVLCGGSPDVYKRQVQSGGVSGGAAADDDHVIDFFHRRLLTEKALP